MEETRIINGDQVKLVLHRIYGNDQPYIFKLCCKEIVEIYNACPKQTLGLKIPKCIEVKLNGNNTVFCLDNENIVINYLFGGEAQTPTVTPLNGCWLIELNTEQVEHVSKLCVTDISIPVQTDCLDEANLGQCVPLNEFITVECMTHYDIEEFRNCWLSILQEVSDRNPSLTVDSFMGDIEHVEPPLSSFIITGDTAVSHDMSEECESLPVWDEFDTIMINLTDNSDTIDTFINLLYLEDRDIIDAVGDCYKLARDI